MHQMFSAKSAVFIEIIPGNEERDETAVANSRPSCVKDNAAEIKRLKGTSVKKRARVLFVLQILSLAFDKSFGLCENSGKVTGIFCFFKKNI